MLLLGCLFAYMPNQSEPKAIKSLCAYCGDAPINHQLFYVLSIISGALDNHIAQVTKHAPNFLKNFVEWFVKFLFDMLVFFKLAQLSDDITKAKTFRSRVIWEEANKRGIEMKQVIMFGKPIDEYRAKINGKFFYFNSLPIPVELLVMDRNWDDKFVLKQELYKNNIPAPYCLHFSSFFRGGGEKIFSKFAKPMIVKPKTGSRGRHTVTNIKTLEEFNSGVKIAGKISSSLVAEEHLDGYVCRATFVNGELLGFYRGGAPFVEGDGVQTIKELIESKNYNRPDRVEKISANKEIEEYIGRSGFNLNDVLPKGFNLRLTHRTGRLFGGVTREMLDELHPSFVPILTEASRVVGLPVIGFDCIVPDPTANALAQKWGIIECNTLPFIDLHYYAFEGKPKNIAGAVWDLWK